MRSRHVERFNHDEDAATYDADVADESHPVREGYCALLDWVVNTALVDDGSDVLDLGAGTGNLTRRLSGARHITAVDTSRRMLEIARTKCAAPNITWVQADLLQVFGNARPYHRIVSTYAIHHLEDDEKRTLFHAVRHALLPGGRAVFGDLMFETAAARKQAIGTFRGRGFDDVAAAIEAEYFWQLDDALPALHALGFMVSTKRFSELSWGLVCTLPPATSPPSAASTAR